jgi:hypothetical protein
MFTPRSRSLTLGSKGIVEKFKVGMYEVLLAHGDPDPSKTTIAEQILGRKHRISEALSQLPMDRRPNVRSDLLEWFDQTYPGWSLVVCVFESGIPMAAQPIMFTYKPFEAFRGRLFFPAVDSHDGGPPKLNERVDVDHFLFASHSSGNSNKMGHIKSFPDILRETKLIGAKFQNDDQNGDWILYADEKLESFTYQRDLFHRTKP